LRDVTDQTIQRDALTFVNLVNLSDNNTTKLFAYRLFYVQLLHHLACNSVEFEKRVKFKKEEEIETGRNCIKKKFMICFIYQIVFGV